MWEALPMTQYFDPRRILRQITIPLLQQFFTRRGELRHLPWDELKEKRRYDVIYDAWQQLPDEQRCQVQVLFRKLATAGGEHGLRAFAELLLIHDPDNAWKLAACKTRLNKAMWFYLHYPQLFDQAMLFAQADALSHGRFAVRRNSLPKRPIQVTPEVTNALAGSLTEYFWPNELRGQHCRIEHYSRPDGSEYFFAQLDNWADSPLEFDHNGRTKSKPRRFAFDVLFVASPQQGTLELVTRGGREVQYALQRAFCRSVLGLDVEPCDPQKPTFNLQSILDPHFTFPTDPADGIARVRLVRIYWLPNYGSRDDFLQRGFSQYVDRPKWVQKIHRLLQAEGYTAADVTVKKAVVDLTLMTKGVKSPEIIRLNVSLPSWSNLASLPDEHRAIGERCFRLWGWIRE
jgi:hypothetical protein